MHPEPVRELSGLMNYSKSLRFNPPKSKLKKERKTFLSRMWVDMKENQQNLPSSYIVKKNKISNYIT